MEFTEAESNTNDLISEFWDNEGYSYAFELEEEGEDDSGSDI